MLELLNQIFPFFLFAFSSLFTLVNPVGLSPTFLSLVSPFDDEEKKGLVVKVFLQQQLC
jgi:small neutral amino acid transporter SnatA (MarC family)